MGREFNKDNAISKIEIYIGQRNEAFDDRKAQVYIDGKKIENMRGFEFSCHVDSNTLPIIKIEKYAADYAAYIFDKKAQIKETDSEDMACL